MKSVSGDFIDNEESYERKPVEIYHFWTDEGDHWRYTSGDVTVNVGGNDYSPIPIKRSTINYDNKINTSKVVIQTSYDIEPFDGFASTLAIEQHIWLDIKKLHRSDLTESLTIFLGQISNIDFKGLEININCIGFENFLNKPVPYYKYQITCNNSLYDSKCGLSASSYKTTTAVTVSADGLTLTSASFGAQSDGY